MRKSLPDGHLAGSTGVLRLLYRQTAACCHRLVVAHDPLSSSSSSGGSRVCRGGGGSALDPELLGACAGLRQALSRFSSLCATAGLVPGGDPCASASLSSAFLSGSGGDGEFFDAFGIRQGSVNGLSLSSTSAGSSGLGSSWHAGNESVPGYGAAERDLSSGFPSSSPSPMLESKVVAGVSSLSPEPSPMMAPSRGFHRGGGRASGGGLQHGSEGGRRQTGGGGASVKGDGARAPATTGNLRKANKGVLVRLFAESLLLLMDPVIESCPRALIPVSRVRVVAPSVAARDEVRLEGTDPDAAPDEGVSREKSGPRRGGKKRRQIPVVVLSSDSRWTLVELQSLSLKMADQPTAQLWQTRIASAAVGGTPGAGGQSQQGLGGGALGLRNGQLRGGGGIDVEG
uniref:Uncharacterized protein n=1 Tax=Chromera velia CCMP2878 TaxID=1169474 RepID=A0A0G4HFZ0_9ALVE|eukprot:Cvel_27214.t1-p1 / transcript=Cvel_27214.t1 / gene=Cvel_27214 / organism=Chromera_velia_CCMP2878 / gene_product=hypothetical protein / transcript_product=hypothetical protein / location=Cvel_scaffold3364:928-2572(+) / protein_length=399 / sequence_SO=supercontig / SO=protein_coding / is_pseudo=false